jgi:hypothetical protein
MTMRPIFSLALLLGLVAWFVSGVNGSPALAQTSGQSSTDSTTSTKTTAVSIQSFSKQFATGLKDATTELESYKTIKTAADQDKVAARKQENEQKKLAQLKRLGDKLIAVRLQVIDRLKKLPGERCDGISTDMKAAYLANITTIETNLKDEKTRLDAATTVDGAKTIIKELFDKNQIFNNFSPANIGFCAAIRLQVLIDKVQQDSVKWKADGADPTALDQHLADAKTSVGQALDIYKTIAGTPAGDSKTAKFDEAKALMTKARDSLKLARADIVAIQTQLKSAGTTSSSPTTTTPSP